MQIPRTPLLLTTALMLLSAPCRPAAAQSLAAPAADDTSRVLTLQEAIDLSYRQNPVIEAERIAHEAAIDRRKAAWGLRMPQIGVNASYTYMSEDIKAFDLNAEKDAALQQIGQLPLPFPIPSEILQAVQSLDLSLTLQKQQFAVVGATVAVPLYMGGRINAAVNAAKINIEKSSQEALQAQTDLFAEVVERYYGLALARHVLRVRQQVTEGMQKHLDDARKLEENGMIAYSERLYVEVKMAEAERELENAKLQLQTISSALKNTLGTGEGAYRPITSMFVLTQLEDAAYYKALAADRNPLLTQVELKSRLAEEGVKARRSDFLPQVVAMGGASFYNYQVTGILPRWAVGVGVNLKIFDGLNREYKYSAARQTVRRVDALRDKAAEDIAVLVEKLYNQLNNYANQIVSIDSSIAFAEEYLKVKNAAFLEGMSSSSDLIDAELNLAKVRTERMQAAFNYDLTLAQLLEAAGISDEFTSYIRRADARRIAFEQK